MGGGYFVALAKFTAYGGVKLLQYADDLTLSPKMALQARYYSPLRNDARRVLKHHSVGRKHDKRLKTVKRARKQKEGVFFFSFPFQRRPRRGLGLSSK